VAFGFATKCHGPRKTPENTSRFGWCEACTTHGMSQTQDHDRVDLSTLTQLRDEIRVRVHLAQLDAKDKWQELESQLASLEHRVTTDGGTLLGATTQLARDLKQSLLEFRQRLSA
jgi:hypothetical protein